MKSFTELEGFQDWIESLKQNVQRTNIKQPTLTHHWHLEEKGLLEREVVKGIPQIKVNLMKSCNWEGCIESHSGIHTRIKVKDIDGLPHSFGVPCEYCGLTNKYLMRFKASGLTADAIGKHVGNYDFDPILEKKTKSFVFGEIRGGLLYGNTGNGKTHLLCGVARELIWTGKKVRYVSHQSLLEQIKQSFDKNSDVDDPRYSWLDGVDAVVFDELGFFRINEWSKQTTNELIHAIYSANIQVLFASNMQPREMMHKFLDMRSVSRIGEMCTDFRYEMKGADRRGSSDFWK